VLLGVGLIQTVSVSGAYSDDDVNVLVSIAPGEGHPTAIEPTPSGPQESKGTETARPSPSTAPPDRTASTTNPPNHGGSLPWTGTQVFWAVLAAVTLITAGAAVRRLLFGRRIGIGT
jgi:hypothetical protein